MRVKPREGTYNVQIGEEVIVLHVTASGAWHETPPPESKMIHWFWVDIGEGGPVLVSLTGNGCIFLALMENGEAVRIILNGDTGLTEEGDGSYGPV